MTKTILAALAAAAVSAAPIGHAGQPPAPLRLAAGDSPDADNTGRNVRDRDDATLTPLDQGTSEQDVDITKLIRQALMESEKISTNAKNVKVITVDRVVTLRGPVESAAERDAIGAVATHTAGVARVDNQLEVDTD